VFAAVVGPPGIGKSELVAELVQSPVPDGLLVLRGGCVQIPGIDVQSPYGPFMEAVRRIPRTAGEEVWARARRWLRPEAGASAHPVDPAEERRAELLRLIGESARDRTVVLVLEDLHWADRSSLGLLIFLARNLTDERVLVIATARSGDDLEGEWRVPGLEHLRRLPEGCWVELAGLPDEDIARIARDVGATGGQVEQIVRLAEGSPLLAKEMAERCIRGESVIVPDGTRDIVRGCLQEITPLARRVVGAAAVVGAEVSGAMLSGLLQRPGESTPPILEEALAEAVTRKLLTFDGRCYRFRHALERQAVYDQMPPPERDRWHQQVARNLDEAARNTREVPPERWAEIAAHWALTDETAAAAAAALRAGMAAYAVSAFPEALTHLENGRRKWRSLDGDPAGWAGHWLEVTRAAAESARWTGDVRRGLSMLVGAVEVAAGVDRALLWDRIGRFRREIGDGVGALEAYERALSVPRDELDASTWAHVLAGHAALLMTTFQLGPARRQCEAALDAAGPQPSPARANALNTLGVVEVLTGDPDRGLALLEESREIALSVGSEEDLWRYVGNATFALQNLGRTAEAVQIALAQLDRARDAGVHRSAAVLPTLINAVSSLVLLGRWTEALDLADEALAGAPTPGHAASMHIAAAEIHALRGEREQARAALDAAREGAENAGEPELLGHICRIEAELMAWTGNLTRARQAVDEGLAAVPDDDPDSRLQLTRVGMRVEADAATLPQTHLPDRVRRLEGVANTAAASLTPLHGFRTDPGATLVLTCQAEAARSRRRDTPQMWQQVAAGWDEARWPYPAAYARLRQAEALLRTADRRAATQPLGTAASTAAELRAAPLAEAIEGTARRGRVQLPDPGPGQPPAPARPRAMTQYGLTAREVQVLAVLATGAHNHEIASELGITLRTVTTHLTHIYRKLKIERRRAKAVEAVHKLRLLEPSEG
jgi:DNA-binding CsgD family transcriptional regulator